MIQALIDKIEHQAASSALLKQQAGTERKMALHWQQQAVDLAIQKEETAKHKTQLQCSCDTLEMRQELATILLETDRWRG